MTRAHFGHWNVDSNWIEWDVMRSDVVVVYIFMHDQLSVIDVAKILFYNKDAVQTRSLTNTTNFCKMVV